jgi:hypothetical protein
MTEPQQQCRPRNDGFSFRPKKIQPTAQSVPIVSDETNSQPTLTERTTIIPTSENSIETERNGNKRDVDGTSQQLLLQRPTETQDIDSLSTQEIIDRSMKSIEKASTDIEVMSKLLNHVPAFQQPPPPPIVSHPPPVKDTNVTDIRTFMRSIKQPPTIMKKQKIEITRISSPLAHGTKRKSKESQEEAKGVCDILFSVLDKTGMKAPITNNTVEAPKCATSAHESFEVVDDFDEDFGPIKVRRVKQKQPTKDPRDGEHEKVMEEDEDRGRSTAIETYKPIRRQTVRKNYVKMAKSAPKITTIPSTACAITQKGLSPSHPDSKVPPPKECGQRPLCAYSWFVYEPDLPPHPSFKTWPEFLTWLKKLVYRSEDWTMIHPWFASASFFACALGLSTYKSTGKAYNECVFQNLIQEESDFKERIMERGLRMEPFHYKLLKMLHSEYYVVEADCPSEIHPIETWIMATPDAKIYELNKTTGEKGKLVGVSEFKTPDRRDAFLEIPEDYMAQVQVSMEVSNVEFNDFSSLRIDDYTGYSEWVVIRVHRSREYWNRALAVMRDFARAVLTKSFAPPKGTFVAPKVKTETLIRSIYAIDHLPDGREMLAIALNGLAETAARKVAEIHQRNLLITQQKFEAENIAQRKIDEMFDNE